MTNPDYLKCPGSDPLPRALPEFFACPECAAAVEIWSDEVCGKCSSCNLYFKKDRPPNTTEPLSMDPHEKDERLKTLIRDARQAGATEAVVVSAKDIIVDASLADRCHEPRCEQYGLSKSCPPHVAGPYAFIDLLEKFSQAIFFKIEAPSEILYSSERREFSQLLHEIAAGIEQAAVNSGFVNARAYAGGSCKKIFCHEHPECRALLEKGSCRNPQLARPSMSGFGINVSKLAETAGWKMNWDAPGPDSTTTKMAGVYGLVLID